MIEQYPVSTEIKELGLKIEARRKELADTWEKNYDVQAKATKLKDASLEEFLKGEQEISDLQKQYLAKATAYKNEIELKRMQSGEGNGLDFVPGRRLVKSVGDTILDAPEFKGEGGRFKNFKSAPVSAEFPDIELKTLMTTGANGYPPFVTRTGEIVYQPTGQIVLQDFMPQDMTTQNAIKFIQETVYGSAAAPRAEGAAYQESTLTYAEATVYTESISTIIPVSDAQLEDVPELIAIINNRLGTMIRQKLQDQQINGNGTAPNLTGFLNASGILSVSYQGDAFSALLQGITKVNSNNYANAASAHCNAMVINPQDLQNLRLTKNSIGDYILGNPGAPMGNLTIWGVAVAETEKIAQGNVLTGDFAMFSHLWTRKGLTIEIGYNASDFGNGRKSVRAEIRAANEIGRASAFCEITGLPA
jgi:HK97 family phage major capsid protein